MKKFEYKIIKTKQEGFWDPKIDSDSLEIGLNTLGNQGWELVTSMDTSIYQGATKEIILFLKREIG